MQETVDALAMTSRKTHLISVAKLRDFFECRKKKYPEKY